MLTAVRCRWKPVHLCTYTSNYLYNQSLVTLFVIVLALVREDTGERLDNNLPKIFIITLSPLNTGRVYGSTQHAVIILEDPEGFSDSYHVENSFI